MPELKVITLRGDVLALDVTTIRTVRQLKARLLEQFPCEDPIEQKIRRATVFQGNSLLNGAQTLNEVGLDAESEVSVVYTSHKLEAASKHDVHLRGFFAYEYSSRCDGGSNIQQNAFTACISLKDINIPDSVTSIGDFALNGIRSFKSSNIPDAVTSIEYCAYAECVSLESIDIPDSVTSIESGAFAECVSLESVNMPDSVTGIGDSAFSGRRSLKSINIPSVIEIEGDAFIGCLPALKSIVCRQIRSAQNKLDVRRKYYDIL